MYVCMYVICIKSHVARPFSRHGVLKKGLVHRPFVNGAVVSANPGWC